MEGGAPAPVPVAMSIVDREGCEYVGVYVVDYRRGRSFVARVPRADVGYVATLHGVVRAHLNRPCPLIDELAARRVACTLERPGRSPAASHPIGDAARASFPDANHVCLPLTEGVYDDEEWAGWIEWDALGGGGGRRPATPP
jgi:hypothetical protein